MSLVYDQKNKDIDLESFRKTISELDKSVLLSYGWGDIKAEYDFIEWNGRTRFTLNEEVRGEIFRRLLKLNLQRSDEPIIEGKRSSCDSRSTSVASRSRRTSKNDLLQPELNFETALAEASGTTDYANAILDFLAARGGWHAKADILAATGITDGQWNAAIAGLIPAGKVERQGERRGALYQAVNENGEA